LPDSASGSSHTWFVLKYLLGYNNVRNYERLVDGMGQPDRLADRQRNSLEAQSRRGELEHAKVCYEAGLARLCASRRGRQVVRQGLQNLPKPEASRGFNSLQKEIIGVNRRFEGSSGTVLGIDRV